MLNKIQYLFGGAQSVVRVRVAPVQLHLDATPDADGVRVARLDRLARARVPRHLVSRRRLLHARLT